MSKYLTKSKFKLGKECPTKLYYHGNRDTYADTSMEDSFLAALAQGGFQVGELAKVYNPGGIDIKPLDHEEAINLTKAELAKENCVIYEPAFLHNNLFVRVDILRKKGNIVDLIEVKAKSIDPSEDNPFWDKRAIKKGVLKLKKSWAPYLFDVAFQTYVLKKAHPDWHIRPYLMMADKSAEATIDGLNQKFKILEKNSRTEVQTDADVNLNTLGDKVLVEINVSEQVSAILEDRIETEPGSWPFSREVEFLSDLVSQNKKAEPTLSSECKKCQFRSGIREDGKKSGFHECWAQIKRKPEELDGPFVFDIWDFRKSKGCMSNGVYLARDLVKEDLKPKANEERAGMSSSERKWLQVDTIQSRQTTPSVRTEELAQEMKSWIFPLHFIDFETSMVALPFSKGRRPYEQIAFQFSHHTMSEDGQIRHVGEYISRKTGQFPNFEFVRELKNQLEGDSGSIFRYSSHENSVLCQIFDQLQASNEDDKNELREWIQTITSRTPKAGRAVWQGPRDMIDLCDIVKRYYYHPAMGGSNSLKKVLPAILKDSSLLQTKYGKPLYGTADMPSTNFPPWQWVRKGEDGEPQDPYKLLPSIFEGVDTSNLDLYMGSDELADGGAAMTAYAKMQFGEMSSVERDSIASALLKYCELDTLAMVMLYEYLADIAGISQDQSVA